MVVSMKGSLCYLRLLSITSSSITLFATIIFCGTSENFYWVPQSHRFS